LRKQKFSEAERERMKPLERNERVCDGYSDIGVCPNGKSGIISYNKNKKSASNEAPFLYAFFID